jgi:hypothetical protein
MKELKVPAFVGCYPAKGPCTSCRWNLKAQDYCYLHNAAFEGARVGEIGCRQWQPRTAPEKQPLNVNMNGTGKSHK